MATTPAKATFPLILEDTYVRQDEQGRFSLNDLHQAAGGEQRHRPNYWLETKQTQDLIAELGNSWNSMSSPTQRSDPESAWSPANNWGGGVVPRLQPDANR